MPKKTVSWNDKGLRKLLMLKVKPQGKKYKIDALEGAMADGTIVNCKLPFSELDKQNWITEFYKAATNANIYINKLCPNLKHIKVVDFS